jgi:uncharacterized protein YqjF (DUF2071 family)
MRRPFLTAQWRNLFLATYAVPADLLKQHLPPGLELDTRNGSAFVSLVAFEFRDTRVFGLPWPGYRYFPELNLRFYVRHGTDRGVIFVREFVQKRLVAWLARTIYNEPYKVAPLTNHCQEDVDNITMEYRLGCAGREHVLRVTGRKPASVPPVDSDEHFFKEHHWGFGRTRRGQAIRYRVEHPVWEVFPVQSYLVDLDWRSVYGPDWEMLNKATPVSTVFAAGSTIAVYPKGHIALLDKA